MGAEVLTNMGLLIVLTVMNVVAFRTYTTTDGLSVLASPPESVFAAVLLCGEAIDVELALNGEPIVVLEGANELVITGQELLLALLRPRYIC